MVEAIVVPVVFFCFLAAVILIPIWLRERTRQSAHRVISQALERGQALEPELVRELTHGRHRHAKSDQPRRTLGAGVVLLALAGGFAAASFVIDGLDPSGSTHNGMLVPAVILGALGLAFLLLAIVDYASKKKDP